MGTVMNWRTDLPENTELEVLEAFACDFIPVLVTGRFSTNESLFVDIVNRMRRKKTGYRELDDSNSLNVPLDGKWHWQSCMSEILAWSPLPEKDDERWIPVEKELPENSERIYSAGRMKAVSVLALCEVIKGCIEVKLVNRLKIQAVGNDYLDHQATDGWVWSDNAGDVKAWMSFPDAFEQN